MTTRWIDAAFVRGGTSNGLFFDASALPDDKREWDVIFSAALGSPDPFGRQLDGMGGGISSLSKVMIVAPSDRADTDIDYTFGQVSVTDTVVDYSANCGNLTSGVVPFALLTGMISVPDGPQSFRLRNTNTGKLVVVNLTVEDGQAAVTGELVIPGVSGAGAPIELVMLDPGGSRTSGLLPTGQVTDKLDVDGQFFEVSLVDATVPLVIVSAHQIGLDGTETPDKLEANTKCMTLLDKLRRQGAVKMGLTDHPDSAPLAVPKIAVVATPAPSTLIDGTTVNGSDIDVLVRMISMERAHKAVPGTGAMCLAAAARIPETVVARILDRKPAVPGALKLGTPSGVVTASAVSRHNDVNLVQASLFRTARVMMRGQVAVELPPAA